MNRPRILIVDDDPGMLRATERVLAGQYEVASYRSSREALARASGFAPDIALLDVRMPELSGFELREALEETCRDVDVIFMTGSLNEIDAALVRAIRAKAFFFIQKPFDREVLLTLVERCVELRRLSAANRRHVSRLEAELAAARAFQRSLLPPESARVGGLSIAVRYIPSAELGGDFYDYASASPTEATVLIADAAGHGVSAAMLTGVVKAAFDASRGDHYEPRAVVRRIADGLRGFEHQRFVTATCVRIDSSRGILEYVNAGHPAGAVWFADGLTRLEPTGPIICSAFPGAGWEQATISVSAGRHVLLFTDGISECQTATEMFGEGRIIDECLRHPSGGAHLLDSILSSVAQFSTARDDDQTLVLATTSG
jgi:sigma-B regulation protein RsbU (phosphoserine phosphatase)